VYEGRATFLSQFRSLATESGLSGLPAPNDPRGFQACKLDFSQRATNRAVYDLHRDLLRLRREDPAFSAQAHRGVDGAVLGVTAFALRFFAEGGQDRLLVINLGRDLHLDPAPEPLLAPPEGKDWAVFWSSEDRRYGGRSTPPLDTDENWRIPGEAAIVLAPLAASPKETGR
jgi:maltooligosyltrehalose trehalohydrolase